MKKIKLTESQYSELKKAMINESEMPLDELMGYNDYTASADFQPLRDALNSGKVVSVAFVKKDGTPRAGVFRKGLASYQYSTRPKTDAQANVKETHGLMNAIDINAYKKALVELGGDKTEAAKISWRRVTLANVIGFLVGGEFIDMREENEIMDRFGEEAYAFLTKNMQAAMNRAQQQAENDPDLVEDEPQIAPETEITEGEWTLDGKDDNALGANEYQTAFEWVKHFGGEELLRKNNIGSGWQLLKAIKDGVISIEDLDEVTAGAHGQAGDIPFSETGIGKNIVLPHINKYKNELPLEEEDEALTAHEKARNVKDESLRTLGYGYHGGIESKAAGRAGNRRDLYEDINQIKKWNQILNENLNEDDVTAPNGGQQPQQQNVPANQKMKMDVKNLSKSSSINQQQNRAKLINNPQEYAQAFEMWVKGLGIQPGRVSKGMLLTIMSKKLIELGYK